MDVFSSVVSIDGTDGLEVAGAALSEHFKLRGIANVLT